MPTLGAWVWLWLWLWCVRGWRACGENAPKARASCHSGTVYFHISVNENNHFVLEMNPFNMCLVPVSVCVCVRAPVLAKNAKSTVYTMQKKMFTVAHIYAFCVRINSKENPIMRSYELLKYANNRRNDNRQSPLECRLPEYGMRIYERKKVFALCWLCDSAWLGQKLRTTHGRHGNVGRHSRIRAASTHRFTKWIILMMKILLRSCNVINNNIRNSCVCVCACASWPSCAAK